MDRASFPPGTAPVAVGEILAGKYRVDHVLGVGGMGVVVAATHLQLDQRVALKFMLVAGVSNASLLERFSREARAAVRLRSDHVARVLDVGTLASGSPYMVMEYLEGNDLGDVLEKQGPLPVEGAVDCVLQACDAVAEAHSLGIVHRDLKPRNLFLTRRNDGGALVKVLDFGISKHKAAIGDLSLTRTTEIIGSPNYMSPEQFRAARSADERSDIWALGVILYELLAGQVPFPADSVTQLTVMVLTEPPRPLQALRANVPAELVRVIERCLAKDPAARFQTVADLALALQRHAPADARELATRIARIGSGRQSAAAVPSPRSDRGALAGSHIDGRWSSTTPDPTRPVGRRIALPLVLAGIVSATVVGGGFYAFGRHPTQPVWQTASEVPPAAASILAPPRTSPSGATPDLAPIELPPLAAASAGVADDAARPPRPTATSLEAAHTPGPHAAGAANAARAHAATAHPSADSGAPDDSPRYRTNW